MKKRILTILIAIAMVMNMTPYAVMTSGAVTNVASVTVGGTTTEYSTLADAVAAVADCTASDNAKITVLADIDQGDSYQEISSGVFTIDLNGKEISTTCPEGGSSALTITGGTVTIMDSATGGKVTGGTNGVRVDNADLTVTGGTFTGVDTGLITFSGTLEITGGTFTSTANYGKGISSNDTTVTISGGTFRAFCYGADLAGGSVTISGGEFIGDDNRSSGIGLVIPASLTYSTPELTVTGGTFSGRVYGMSLGACTASISGADISGSNGVDIYSYIIPDDLKDYGYTDTYANISISNSTIDGYIDFSFQDSVSKLTLGANTSFTDGIRVTDDILADILGEGMAYYQNGSAVTLTEGQIEITDGDVTVKAAPTPTVTGVSFNESSPAYDSATNTFNVSDSNPFILTITGERLSELPNNALRSLFFGDAQGSGGVIIDVTVESDTRAYVSVNTSRLTYILNNAVGSGSSSTKATSVMVQNDGVTVGTVNVNLVHAPPPPTPIGVSLEVTKSFNDWSKADSFTFILDPVTAGAPMPASTTAIATKSTPFASFGTITFEAEGTYEYTITEVDDGIDGITYDKTEHEVVVTVTKGANNSLTAVVTYDGEESLIITNTYTKPVRITAVDAANGSVLEGVTAQIANARGTIIYEWTITAEVHEIFGLNVGETYNIFIAYVPGGYTIPGTVLFSFDNQGDVDYCSGTISDDGVILIEVENTEVSVAAVDADNGLELAGATVQIIDSEGYVVEQWVSGPEAHIIAGLNIGEAYTVRIFVAPDGYEIPFDTTFALNEDGNVASTGSVTEDGVILVVLDKTPEVKWGASADASLTEGTLAEAIAAEAAYIQLQKDIASDSTLTFNNSVTIDLNGKTLEVNTDTAYAVFVYDDLTVTDTSDAKNGRLSGTTTYSIGNGVFAYSITVSGGTLSGTAEGTDGIGVFADSTLTVENDGKITATGATSVFIGDEANSSYTVKSETTDTATGLTTALLVANVPTYTVTVNTAENGTVTADKTEAAEGETVTLTVTPTYGYVIDTLVVTNEAGHVIHEDTPYFTMPAYNVTVKATFAPEPKITDIYVPEETPGYDPETKEFVITPENPLIFVWEGVSLHLMPDNWQVLIAGLSNNDPVCGPAYAYTTNVTETKLTFCLDFNTCKAILSYIDGSYIGKTVYFSVEDAQLSDVKLYYSYVTVVQGENGTISVPYGMDPGETATVTITPDEGYKLDTLTVTDANGNPVTVENNTFTVPQGGATVTATFEVNPVSTTELNNAVKALEEKIAAQVDPDELEAAIKNVTDIIAALDDTYSTDAQVAADIDAAKEAVTDAYTKALDEAISDVKTLIDSNTASVSQINDALDDINDILSSLDNTYVNQDEMDNTLNRFSGAINNLADLIDSLQNDVVGNETDIASLNGRVQIISNTVNELAVKFPQLSDTVDGLTKDLGALSDSLNDLLGRVTEVEKAIAELEEAVKDIKLADTDNAKALADAIDKLNKAIAAAEKAALAGDGELAGRITEAVTKAENDLAAAVKRLEELVGGVQSDLDKVKSDLDKAIRDLAMSMANANSNISAEIARVNDALEKAQAALEKADAGNKAELINRINAAEATLKAAVEKVQNDLENAKNDLQLAISNGDKNLDDKIIALNKALVAAEAALKETDAANKTALEAALASAELTLKTAIEKVQANLDNVQSDLENRIKDLELAMYQKDYALDNQIISLNSALTLAKLQLEQADAENKEYLEAKIAAAEKLLYEAINSLQSELSRAKSELENAIAAGDSALGADITVLNDALVSARSALEAADEANRAELLDVIASAELALEAAIEAVQNNLDSAKAELSNAIANGDSALDERIGLLSDALATAKEALEQTDAANKTELEAAIANAQTALAAAIDEVDSDLAEAQKKLAAAIADGDSALSDRISALSTALDNAISAYKAADGELKTEMTAKIEAADATLDAAIKAVQKSLDDARTELNRAITDGDTALDSKITALNEALAVAKAALEAADTANKSELTTKIDEAYASLDAAIRTVQKNLDDLKAELEAKDNELQTFIIIVCVISGVALCGSGAFIVWFFIDRKKRF